MTVSRFSPDPLVEPSDLGDGVNAIRAAIRTDPNSQVSYLSWLGLAEFTMGHYSKAAETLRTVLERNPDQDIALIVLISALGHLGDLEGAQNVYKNLNDLREQREADLEAPAQAIEVGVDRLLVGPYTLKDVDFWPFKNVEDRERLREGMRLAGVPVEYEASTSPLLVDGAITIDAATAKELLDEGAAFVDVRTLELWRLGRIPGAILLDLKTDFTEDKLAALAGKDEKFVIYCEGPKCLRSSQACVKAVSWGFNQVYYFREGMPGWRAAGLAVEAE